ncbi:MAG TPA: cobalamin-binding protein [Clostridiaceae bacterium]|nr:cobalamin-binding protein [Clostridiaceae bacterium]
MANSLNNIVYGFIKPANDAHTLGLQSAAELLRECNYQVIIAEPRIQEALSNYREAAARRVIIDWIRTEKINRLGLSYRLDQTDAVNMVGYLYEELKNAKLMSFQSGAVEMIIFAGLPQTCQSIQREFKGPLICFHGGESVKETLELMRVPTDIIPKIILEVGKYDDSLMQFGRDIIAKSQYLEEKNIADLRYPEFGTGNDSLLRRLAAVQNSNADFIGQRPLIRAHVGPYSADQERLEAVQECGIWCKQLAQTGLLDILSLGTSQLSQSNFGEDWTDKINGGGVPVNSISDLHHLYEAAQPMLMRTYAGTKNIPDLAKKYEESINICWHALSFWWFNSLDGRGPYDLYTNLHEHIKTVRYIATTNKPFEANVSHHFAFRGSDDITYIVSVYLAAKLAKKLGIRTFILQNMLNTPRSTWGVQDLAKSRAMLRILRSLEDEQFKIILQPRAGLDYFKPDLDEARAQLAAITCLMDDIEPNNMSSPSIIHVVSYSEASHLATPDIIKESVQITLHALKRYRQARLDGMIDDMTTNTEVLDRERSMYNDARTMISELEQRVPDLYSAEGFYKIFLAGYLPVPYLWDEEEEYRHAKELKTKSLRGTTVIVDKEGHPLPIEERLSMAAKNLSDAEYYLRQQKV